MNAQARIALEALDDLTLASLAAARDADAVRLITVRNNQRLFRAAWSVLKNRAEAEEAVQDGHLKAFAAIAKFEGKSALSTWLTRIVINEALGRRRSAARRAQDLEKSGVSDLEDYRQKLTLAADPAPSPEAEASRAQIARLLELRARRRLQQELDPELKGLLGETFAFAGPNCERMTARVMAALGL